MFMLGGAAKGSYGQLDGSESLFEYNYNLLAQFIRQHEIQGIDLDVEEYMSLRGIKRLIDRFKLDFGDKFIITLAPVATALCGGRNLSGFNYETLEVCHDDNAIIAH